MSALLSQEQLRSQRPLTLCHLCFPGSRCQDAVQLAMEMALVSEGGSMGTWQTELGLAIGRAQALSTNSALRIFQSSEQCFVVGISIPILKEGAVGVGELQELLRSDCWESACRPGPWFTLGLPASLPLAPRAAAWGGAGSECLSEWHSWWWQGFPSLPQLPQAHTSQLYSWTLLSLRR